MIIKRFFSFKTAKVSQSTYTCGKRDAWKKISLKIPEIKSLVVNVEKTAKKEEEGGRRYGPMPWKTPSLTIANILGQKLAKWYQDTWILQITKKFSDI